MLFALSATICLSVSKNHDFSPWHEYFYFRYEGMDDPGFFSRSQLFSSEFSHLSVSYRWAVPLRLHHRRQIFEDVE